MNKEEKDEDDDITLVFMELEESIENTLIALRQDLGKINIGRAQSDIFDLLKVEYYGAMTALSHCCVISVRDFNKVTIEPYEKSYAQAVDKVIRNSGLEVSSQLQGSIINVYFPQMTLERRDKLIKLVKQHGEKAKISLRDHRRNGIKTIESLKYGEDIEAGYLKELETVVSKGVSSIEEAVDFKNKKLQEMR